MPIIKKFQGIRRKLSLSKAILLVKATISFIEMCVFMCIVLWIFTFHCLHFLQHLPLIGSFSRSEQKCQDSIFESALFVLKTYLVLGRIKRILVQHRYQGST